MAELNDILSDYKRMRVSTRELSSEILHSVSASALKTAGRKLGLWHRGSLVLDNVDQSSVVMDSAIHGCLEAGRNAVDRYVAANPPLEGSDRQAALAAMQRAFFSVFQVTEVVKGIGVRVKDLLRDENHLLADVGFSQTAARGVTLATRVYPFEDFIMSPGAAVPITDVETLAVITGLVLKEAANPAQIKNLSREQWADLTFRILAAGLSGPGATQIRYEEPGEAQGASPRNPRGTADAVEKKPHPRRNDPCPCGSGHKYKKCCGR